MWGTPSSKQGVPGDPCKNWREPPIPSLGNIILLGQKTEWGPRITSHASWPCHVFEMVLCLNLCPVSIIPTLWSKPGLVRFILTSVRLRMPHDRAGIFHLTIGYNASVMDIVSLPVNYTLFLATITFELHAISCCQWLFYEDDSQALLHSGGLIKARSSRARLVHFFLGGGRFSSIFERELWFKSKKHT